MIDLAVNQLADRLQTLSFLDLVGGVARPQKLRVAEVVKTLPATIDPEHPGHYRLLTPDEKRSGIAYFEVLSNRKVADLSGGRACLFNSTVRVIVWMNTKRLAPSTAIPQAMAALVSRLAGKYDDVSPVVNLSVDPLQEAVRSPDLFSKYTYDESEWQHLMLPFEYFAFDFAMSFGLIYNCQAVNIIKTDEQC